MSSTRPTIRMMCVLLAAVIAFCAVPSTLLALGIQSDEYPLPQTQTMQSDTIGVNENTPETNANNLQTSQVTRKDPQILFEIENNRTVNSKQFQMSDGTVLEAHYPIDIHYIADDGTWQNIDNTLTQNRDNGAYYAATRNGLTFAPNTASPWLFSISEEDYTISFKPTGALSMQGGLSGTQSLQSVSAVISNTLSSESATTEKTATDESKATQSSAAKTTQEDWTTLESLTSYVTYANIYPNVDLRYTLYGTSVYKELIVKQATAISSSYAFSMQLDGLVPTMTDEGGILLIDRESKTPVYQIPAPYMKDSAGVYSYDVQYTLSPGAQKDTWNITLTPSTSWLSANDRVYPVTIDPPITVILHQSATDTYISSNTPATAHHAESVLKVGTDSTGTYETYINFYDVLYLMPGNALQKAELHFNATYTNLEETVFGVYPTTSTWPENVTWADVYGEANDTLDISEFPINYISLSGTASNQDVCFDITNYMLEYASQNNHTGILIKQLSTSDSDENHLIQLTSVEGAFEISPTVLLYSTNADGIEDYYSYTVVGVPNGEAFIHHGTGDATVVYPLLATSEQIFGYTANLVYQLSEAYTEEGGAQPGYASFWQGWTPDWEQRVYYVNRITAHYYSWRDGDGTVHYFTADENGVFRDNEGLNLTIVTNKDANNVRTGYTITGTTSSIHFDASGRLSYYEDDAGNQLQFIRNNRNAVVSIALLPHGATTAIEQLQISYDPNELFLSKVYNPITKQSVTFEAEVKYTIGSEWFVALSAIKYKNHLESEEGILQAQTNFTIDNYGRMTQAHNALSRYTMSFEFDTNRVAVIEESVITDSSTTYGNKMGITYEPFKTTVRTRGADSVYGTEDDLLNVYILDTYLRPINQYITNLSGKLYAANYIAYEETDSAPTNGITSSANIGVVRENLLVNGDFELISSNVPGWTVDNTMVVTSRAIDDNNQIINDDVPLQGDSALVATGDTMNEYQDATQTITLLPGTYTFSTYYKPHGGVGQAYYLVHLQVMCGDVLVASETTGGSTQGANDLAQYENISVTFTVPEDGYGTYSLAFGVHLMTQGTHEMAFDNAMLTKSNGIETYNHVENGGFENQINFQYDNWARNESILLPNAFNPVSGFYCYTIAGEYGKEAYASQVVYSASVGDIAMRSFIVSGWGKAPNAVSSGESVFGLKLILTYADNSTTEKTFAFSPHYNEWQYIMGVCHAEDNKIVTEVTIYCLYYNNFGFACFDDIAVVCDTGQSTRYTYNNEGKLASVENANGVISSYTYNSENDMVSSITNQSGQTVNVNYANEDSTQPTSIETNLGENIDIAVSYEYNEYGQTTRTTYGIADSTNLLQSKYTYSTEATMFGYVTTETDANNATTQYIYANGRLIRTLLEDNSGIEYVYDAYGMLQKIVPVANGNTQANGDVAYTYDTAGRLVTITTATTTYTITYDDFGNMKSIRSGRRQILATYNRMDGNGLLESVVYGNGYAEFYTYDELGRVATVEHRLSSSGETSILSKSIYNDEGRLIRQIDHAKNEITDYKYSAQGKLSGVVYKDMSGSVRMSYSISYNEDQKLSGETLYFSESQQSYYHAYSYEYNPTSDLLSGVTLQTEDANVAYVTYQYDNWQRATRYTVQDNNLSFYRNSIYDTYRETIDGTTFTRQTNLPYSYYNSVSYNGTVVYSQGRIYYYDELGRLDGMVEETVDAEGYPSLTSLSYVYDAKGQLVRENNQFLNRTYVYTYDDAGNITSKKEYNYTTATNLSSTPRDQIAYQYSIGEWGDLLISFDGQSILYDNIGNPITYLGNTLSWQGRNLVNVKEGNTTIATYTYDANGLRTSKTVDGVTYHFRWHEGRLVQIKQTSSSYGGPALEIYYQPDGTPLGFRYISDITLDNPTSQMYYYLLGHGNNVIGIISETGQVLVTYEYDAWGNFTESINATYAPAGSTNLAAITLNPLRYRGYCYDTETGWYYLQSRYYNAQVGRFINADSVIASVGSSILGYNLYAYCFNNPVNMSDLSGNWPKWLESAADWVNENIIQPVVNFFDANTNKTSGSFETLDGSYSITGGYSDFNWRFDHKTKISGETDGWLGAFGKISIINVQGKVGTGTGTISSYIKGVADGLVATVQAGLHSSRGGWGVGAKAKAAVLSARATIECNILGWQVEVGLSGDLLSVGAEATIGIFPTETGSKVFRMDRHISHGPYGLGYTIRIKSPY